jgi:hypothetical protein
MRFFTIPLLLILAQQTPKPAGGAATVAPVQVCLFTSGSFPSIGACPPPVAGPAGPAGAQGVPGPVGPQGPPGAAGNLPVSVSASTLPANSLGLVMADGTVIPIQVINQSTLASLPANVPAVAASVPYTNADGSPAGVRWSYAYSGNPPKWQPLVVPAPGVSSQP